MEEREHDGSELGGRAAHEPGVPVQNFVVRVLDGRLDSDMGEIRDAEESEPEDLERTAFAEDWSVPFRCRSYITIYCL